MLFEKFFRTISAAIPADLLVNMEALSALDPDKIYVENVRSILRVPHGVALRICELAVAHGVFTKMVAVECPDGSEAAAAESEENLPATVTCYAETDGFLREVEFQTNALQKVTFYRLAHG